MSKTLEDLVKRIGKPAKPARLGPPATGDEIMKAKGSVDRGLTRRALRDVYLSEKSSTNPKGYGRAQAAAHAIANHGLNGEEVDVLLYGLAIRADETASVAHWKASGKRERWNQGI